MNDAIVFGKLSILKPIRIPVNGAVRYAVKTVHTVWGVSESEARRHFADFKVFNPDEEFYARWQASPVDIS